MPQIHLCEIIYKNFSKNTIGKIWKGIFKEYLKKKGSFFLDFSMYQLFKKKRNENRIYPFERNSIFSNFGFILKLEAKTNFNKIYLEIKFSVIPLQYMHYNCGKLIT